MPLGVRGMGIGSSTPPRISPTEIGRVAQLAEHSALNRQVVGSIPTASTNKFG